MDRNMARVLLVDDDDDIRSVLRIMLSLSGFTVVAESSDGVQGVRDAATLSPHIVVLDMQMPHMSGEHAAPEIRRAAPESKIVAFSAHLSSCPEWADGWLDKTSIGRLPQVIDDLLRMANGGPPSF